ncbi:hypothetical protein B0H17DRAFT_1213057 [Mycena rosella]|uniref:Uncharacterized protein n=1 Tax=Mycena rosella TaxID=1033263 RepID=A0AAD7G4J8_MYCRO|nr:hypothetical protein B0H17DRAFT_1213057 [Mycena rosella]
MHKYVAHDGHSGIHFLPNQRGSSSATTQQIFAFGAHAQGAAIKESFDPPLFGSASPVLATAKTLIISISISRSLSVINHINSHRLSPPPQSNSHHSPHTQFRTPPPSLWTSFPHLPPIPAPSPPPCPPTDPVAAHLDHPSASGSGKRKSRDDDPADDINIHARRPRKMPTRADLWGI